MCGLGEQYRTADHQTRVQGPASANVFVSLGKIFRLNCFIDVSVLGRYWSWEIIQSK